MLNACSAIVDLILLLHLGAGTDAAHHKTRDLKVLLSVAILMDNANTQPKNRNADCAHFNGFSSEKNSL